MKVDFSYFRRPDVKARVAKLCARHRAQDPAKLEKSRKCREAALKNWEKKRGIETQEEEPALSDAERNRRAKAMCRRLNQEFQEFRKGRQVNLN